MRFRLRSPNGNVYLVDYNNVLIPTTGARGHINTHAQAVAGPAQLVGATGYNALYFKPNVVGEWSIEFNRGADATTNPITKTVIKFFDITVASNFGNFGSNTGTYVPAGGTGNNATVLTGRLFSRAWELNMMGNTNPFRAEMFAYTADQVVLRIDFNGMQPFGFVISCNSTGSQNTGDIAVDRRSRVPPAGNVLTRPEYRIFLNDPDLVAYPTGTLPVLSAPTVQVALCTEYEILVTTTSRGFIQILLDLDETTGSCSGTATPYSANGVYNNDSKDRLLGVFAPSAGTYSVPWDGLDGCGDLVPTGTDVTVRARIQSGLTHLPLYDVEGHATGYEVTLVRPIGPPAPRLYWDDSQVGGTVELAGAGSPAHNWTFASNFGNNRTINTWFYIQETVDQVTTFKADNTTFDLSSNNSTAIYNADNIVTFEVIYSEARFGSTTVNYTLQQAVADPNYTFAPYPDGSSYVNDTGTFTDTDGILKRRVFVSYIVTPVGSPTTLDVQLQFTAAADPASCPAPISRQDFVNCENLLPVTLLSFYGKDREKNVLLEWQTANELDNKGFYVQRSINGKDFKDLTFVLGKGTTNNQSSYTFIDEEYWSGTAYYRLAQLDNNGKINLTKTIKVERNFTNSPFMLYPNPNKAGGELHLKGITDKTVIQNLQIISLTGQLVLINPTLKTTFDGIAIDLPQKIAKGIYIIQFVTDFGMQNYKFVIE